MKDSTSHFGEIPSEVVKLEQKIVNRLEEELRLQGRMKGWLANQVGCAKNTITNIINGRMPHLDLADRIAEALGKTVYDIWTLRK
jgi:DNA-binding XRE family transcriptional regulator